MRFLFADHQGKGRAYIQALLASGHERVYHVDEADCAFFGFETGVDGEQFKPELKDLYQRRAPVFIYPHAARPQLIADMYPTWPHIAATFVIAHGHQEVMRRFGYPIPTVIAGWPYCETLPFKQLSTLKRPHVLFGPIHPNMNGWLWPEAVERNRQVFSQLIALRKAGLIDLSVRHVRRLQDNGLTNVPGVTYHWAMADGSTEQIDQADIVVGYQTFAYLAIARGVPTVMIFENEIPRSGNQPDNMVFAKNWTAYRDYMHYPVNYEEQRNMWSALMAATAYTLDLERWKAKFIGEPFNPLVFTSTVDGYLERSKS